MPRKAPVRVLVTPEDILNGDRRMALSCPLARATSRAVGCEVSIGSMSATLYRKQWVNVDLPESARAFRQNFDEGHVVAPISFDIRA